jgi:phage recombination protein Bet
MIDKTDTAVADAPVDADAIRERGKGLEQVTKRGLHTGRPAYEEFDKAMRALVKDTLLPDDASDADLYYLLEVAATYRLDPFAKEIWAIKMPGRNASAKGTLTIMVGRDGLLAIAERHPDFRGFRNAEVYENDSFSYEDEPRQMPDGTFSHVRHSFDVTKDRGPLLGSYAEVYREGRPAVFFWAPLNEYDKSSAEGASPWKKQLTAMIRKVSLANSLRLAYRISGLYIADEMTSQPLEQAPEAVGEDLTNWGDDEAVKARLVDLFFALDESPAKVKLKLAGMSDQDRVDLIDELEAECEKRGVELPPPRDPDEAVVTDEEVEVVDEPAAPAPEAKAGQGKLVE